MVSAAGSGEQESSIEECKESDLEFKPARGNVHDISQSREEFDADQFLFDKKSAIEHFFCKVHEELAS